MFERLRERIRTSVGSGSSTGAASGGRNEQQPPTGLDTLEGAQTRANPGDVGRLKRERRRLLRSRERAVRDLGGLTLEMVRRNVFKPDLLTRRARDILGLEAGVYDVEDALDDARSAAPDPSVGSPSACVCGASNDRSAHFCVACGRALKVTPSSTSCHHCASALPGGAQFCPSCGSAREAAHESPTGAGW